MYKYVQDPSFEILMFAYSLNNAPEEIVDLAQGEEIPAEITRLLFDPACVKSAHNAQFERTCLSAYFFDELPVDQWQCTMIKAAQMGWPMSLEAVAKAMMLSDQKDAEGKALIKYFCVPCKPSKTNGMRERNYPHHAPEKWDAFKNYCKKDVRVERAIDRNIAKFPVHPREKRLYILDQKINDYGILLDEVLATNAIRISGEYEDKLRAEAIELTSLDNPKSPKQILAWLRSEMPLEVITTLRKTDLPDLKTMADGYVSKDTIIRVLDIRGEISKSSVKKYQAMISGLGTGGRVRGLLQFWGANRTARWAGRLVQVQNLPKNEMPAAMLDLARDMVKEGDGDLLYWAFGNVPDTLSQLIRTAFIAPVGKTLIPSDFSAIEARVIAWLAGEKWRLDVFNTHGKIYEASAAAMFKVPIESVTKGSKLRQKGKVAELALGFQGGPNAILSMEISNKVPVEERIPDEERKPLVDAWRAANKQIVKLWYTVQNAALRAMEEGQATIQMGIKFMLSPCRTYLWIRLPSGRKISYVKPQIRTNQFDKPGLTYMGLNDKKQWVRETTYGGKLVENIVQAIARDLLTEKMILLDDAGYKIVMHVHDEVVIEGMPGIDEPAITKIMAAPVSWAPGLPMNADSYETNYYKKD